MHDAGDHAIINFSHKKDVRNPVTNKNQNESFCSRLSKLRGWKHGYREFISHVSRCRRQVADTLYRVPTFHPPPPPPLLKLFAPRPRRAAGLAGKIKQLPLGRQEKRRASYLRSSALLISVLKLILILTFDIHFTRPDKTTDPFGSSLTHHFRTCHSFLLLSYLKLGFELSIWYTNLTPLLSICTPSSVIVPVFASHTQVTNLRPVQSSFSPTQIFEEGTTEEKGENARLTAFVGAIAVGDLVKSTLGPKGMDKIMQSACVSPSSMAYAWK